MSDDYDTDAIEAEFSDGEFTEDVQDPEAIKQQLIAEYPMKITRVYTTIQGEGINVGTPCAIIKFAGCNKKCVWCDINLKKKVEPSFNAFTIPESINEYAPMDLVITGGEPMLQPKALAYIISYALAVRNARGLTSNVCVETNGTISLDVLREYISDEHINEVFWTVSPKLNTSCEDWTDTRFQEFMVLPHVQFKLAMNGFEQEDLNDLREIMCFIPTNVPVIVQPVVDQLDDFDFEAYRKRVQELITHIIDKDNIERFGRVRVIPQIQKFIWGLDTESI